MIEISGLVKDFGALRAVANLDLAVSSGQVHGLLGPNGAGKSTTIRTLLGYLNPTAGKVAVLGGDARDPEIRRRIGYLPGDFRLDRRTRVHQILAWYADLRGGVEQSTIDAMCERMELDQHRPFGQLSKGNRQKVGVIQAVMHAPDVLVLDEPTAGLDPLMQRVVLDMVNERRAAGAAVLFSSHIISEVEEVADRVAILRKGVKVAEDSVMGLQHLTNRQALHLRFASPPDPRLLDGVENVHSFTIAGDKAEVVLAGSVRPLVQVLAGTDIEHISADPVLLDDIFYGVYDAPPPPADTAAEHGRPIRP